MQQQHSASLQVRCRVQMGRRCWIGFYWWPDVIWIHQPRQK